MLPAAHRLRGDANFERLMKHGRSFFSPGLTVRAARNDLTVSRFAFVVSLKVHKKAVRRNTIKRRLREIIRHDLPTIKTGFDILLAAKKPALDYDYQTLRSCTNELLAKARLLVSS